jgi:hypothetical protein
MNLITETLAFVVLFILRLGVPIAVTVLIVGGLRRLDARWQAEADAQRTSRAVASGLIASVAAVSPLAAERPCWERNDCPPEKRQQCAACALTDSKLPARCYGCALFRTRPAVQAQAL